MRGGTFDVTSLELQGGEPAIGYESQETGKQFVSTVPEVRQWVNNATTVSTHKQPFKPVGLALESYYRLQPHQRTAPTSFTKAGNMVAPQWFRAEHKEMHGTLDFNTWQRIPQEGITPEVRKKALRAHHLYSVKRNGGAKNRVVVNGSRQHSSTYTDTTSPVASQLLLRTPLSLIALRKYTCLQGD